MSDSRLSRIEERLRPAEPPEREPAPEGPLAHLTARELREGEAALVGQLAADVRAGRVALDAASAGLDPRQRRQLEGTLAGDLDVRCPVCFAPDHLTGSRPHQIGRRAESIAPQWPYTANERRRAEQEL